MNWIYSIIVGNLSDIVMINQRYENMTKMELVSHLQSKGAEAWETIRKYV